MAQPAHQEHRQQATHKVRCAVITVSDTRTPETDTSGQFMQQAVYSGLVPLERQIGTTGKWLGSEVYIAVGISGAPQHVMGIKAVKRIIAINKAREAPIFKYAKLGIVGDLYQVVPELIHQLKAHIEERS